MNTLICISLLQVAVCKINLPDSQFYIMQAYLGNGGVRLQLNGTETSTVCMSLK